MESFPFHTTGLRAFAYPTTTKHKACLLLLLCSLMTQQSYVSDICSRAIMPSGRDVFPVFVIVRTSKEHGSPRTGGLIVFVVHSSLLRDSSVCLRHPWLLSSFLVARSGIASFCVRREKVIRQYIYRKHSNHIRLIISDQIVVGAAFKPWLAFGLQSFCMRTGPYRFSVRTSS
jgi:hypothetical protein